MLSFSPFYWGGIKSPGFPDGSDGNLPTIQEIWVGSLHQEDPLEKGMATPVFFMDRGAWWATVCGVAKSRTELSDQDLRPWEVKVLSHSAVGGGEPKQFDCWAHLPDEPSFSIYTRCLSLSFRADHFLMGDGSWVLDADLSNILVFLIFPRCFSRSDHLALHMKRHI